MRSDPISLQVCTSASISASVYTVPVGLLGLGTQTSFGLFCLICKSKSANLALGLAQMKNNQPDMLQPYKSDNIPNTLQKLINV